MEFGFLRKITTGLLVLFFMIRANCFSQDYYLVNGKVLIKDNKFDGITVVLSSGNEKQKLQVTSYGGFSAALHWNKKYYFTFRKPGYVSKIIEFSTFLPGNHSHRIEPYALNVRLFPMIEGVDTVFFKKPVAKIYFDKELNDFTDDRDYALQIVYEVDKMISEAKKKQAVKPGNDQEQKKAKEINVSKENDAVAQETDDTPQNTERHPEELRSENEKHASSLSNLLPPLKERYSKEKTVEEFDLNDMHLTRVIIKDGDSYKVYIRVKHDWGGVFYFIDESPLGFFSVTESVFERETNIR